MIMEAPNFPERQFVPLLQHDEPRDQRLVLAPLPINSNTISPEFAIPTPSSHEPPQNYLDLRFWYRNFLDEKETKKLASHFRKLIEEKSISASRIGWLGLKKRDRESSSSSAETWRTVAIKNSPVEPFIGGDIASPARNLCNMVPLESNTGLSAISRRPLESHDVFEVGNSTTGSMDMSRQEHKAMEIVDHDLGSSAASCISREANINQYGHEPMFDVNFDYIKHQAQGALLRGIQDMCPVLGLTAVAVLVLSIRARIYRR